LWRMMEDGGNISVYICIQYNVNLDE